MLEHELVNQAKAFAESEAVAEVLNRLEQKFIADWKATVPVGVETREHYYRMILAVDALRGELKNVAQSTKINEWNRRLRGT
jgi:hypothetical protein